MVRLPLLLLLLVAAAALPAWAQIQPRSLQTVDDPRGEFSLSLRVSGNVSVTFRDVGTLASTKNIGDVESEMTRVYDNGTVLIDSRTSLGGVPLPDDGRTNRWSMGYDSQIVDEDGDGMGDGVAFQRYESRSDGATAEAESGAAPGIDLDYGYTLGTFGGRTRSKSPRGTWGALGGLSFTNINAKHDQVILATLLTVEDRYSLDGAAPPDAPYSAPSNTTVTTTDPDGNIVTQVVDTTTLLANRPYLRTVSEDPEGAEVQGFWQVRGGAFTAKLGLWARYRPWDRVGLRVSAGVTGTYLGLRMRYDEWLDKEELINQIRYQNETSPEKWAYAGAFGTVDAEWWMTDSTSVFIGATYEKADQDVEIPLDGRTADIRLGSGTGFRIGITKLF